MSRGKVLAVDDEAFNLDILGEYLEEAGYQVVSAADGEEALVQLEQHADIDVIVLDRMMPRLDGMECLKRIKLDERWKNIPVIMQTAAASLEHIRQGIEAGVFYYLTKPYEEAMLISLVRSALEQSRSQASLQQAVRQNKQVLGLMEMSRFQFRTLEEARHLAVYIANAFPNPESIVYGLSELMINAIEHGNLGISYEEKTDLVYAGTWASEVDRRLNDPKYSEKKAHLEFVAAHDFLEVCIKDQGLGFKFQNYLDLAPERATDPHGRGIATARMMSFDQLEYQGVGNVVIARVQL